MIVSKRFNLIRTRLELIRCNDSIKFEVDLLLKTSTFNTDDA